MEERLEEQPEELDFGPEHNALVADADQLLSVGKAEEARDVVLRLRMRYPDSPHTRRVNERLRIAGGANEYWRKHDKGNDFHTLFAKGVGGAIGAVGGYACAAFGAIFLIGATQVPGVTSVFCLALGALLVVASFRLVRRYRRS